MCAIARLRLYHSIIKLESNGTGPKSHTNFTSQKMKGHTIVIPHDAPKVSALATLFHFEENAETVAKSMSDLLILVLLGPDGETDKLMEHALGTNRIYL